MDQIVPDDIGEDGLVAAIQMLRGQDLPLEMLEVYWEELG
jgi:hypothetical protein